MGQSWKFNRFRDRREVLRLAVIWFLFQSLSLCWSLNDEGKALLKLRDGIVSDPFGALSTWIENGEVDPCNWFGIECSEGRVVVLILKDLSLGGSLAPELGKLVHIKSIILRNNHFSGAIPEGIVDLKELEILDLGCNNFSGSLPAELGSNMSLAILLLDNNELLGGFSPEINRLKMLSEHQVDESQLINASKRSPGKGGSMAGDVDQEKAGLRRLLQAQKPEDSRPRKLKANSSAHEANSSTHKANSSTHKANSSAVSPAPSPLPHSPPPSSSPSPLTTPKNKANPSAVSHVPTPLPHSPSPSPSRSPPPVATAGSGYLSKSNSSTNLVAILAGVIGGTVFLLISIIGIYLCKTNKVATVKPWATGLSGQLQKAFVTGVPNLKRSELEAACEDFSNVVGTSPIGTVYKGTLSNGVEIAVASVMVTSSKDWTRSLEAQFRKKIDTLSKVNHKNFVNLIGYCGEDEPFTRMVVFEYAPNGSLFEHLHIKEAEHLDWGTRLRIAMGMAYCIQHMHQLNPPRALSNLNSELVFLSDDYAAKISDLSFSAEIKSGGKKDVNLTLASLRSNVYSFGLVLFEMATGQLPYSSDYGSLEGWVSHYLLSGRPLREMVDPTLQSFHEEQLKQISELIISCVIDDLEQRPTMKEVCDRLRVITNITPEAAAPKLTPLWWAELEIASTASTDAS